MTAETSKSSERPRDQSKITQHPRRGAPDPSLHLISKTDDQFPEIPSPLDVFTPHFLSPRAPEMPHPWPPGDKWSEQACPWPGHSWHPERAGCGAKASADLAPGEVGEALPEEAKTAAGQQHEAGPSPPVTPVGAERTSLRTKDPLLRGLLASPGPALPWKSHLPWSPWKAQSLSAECLNLLGHPRPHVGNSATLHHNSLQRKISIPDPSMGPGGWATPNS